MKDYERKCKVCGEIVYHCGAANGSPEDCKPPRCHTCGGADATETWHILPTGGTVAMCTPCHTAAVENMREMLAQGYEF